MKKTIVIVVIICLFLLFGCQEKDDLYININDSEINLFIGETYDLSYTSNADVIISCDNYSLITIENKTVKAINKGTVIITLQIKDTLIQKEINVNINEKKAQRLLINGITEVVCGEKIFLTAIHDEVNVDLKWTISSNIAIIDSEKDNLKEVTINTIEPGEVIVNLEDTISGLKTSVLITIKEKPNEVLSIIGENYVELEKMITFIAFSSFNDSELIWKIDKTYLEECPETGKYKAIKQGSTLITVINIKTNKSITKEIIIYTCDEESINNYLLGLYNNININSDIDFVTRYYNSDITFVIQVYNPKYLTVNGKYNAPILSFDTDITYNYIIDNVDYFIDIPVKIMGYGSEIDVIKKEIDSKIPEELKTSLNLPTKNIEYNATIEWYLNGEYLENAYIELIRDEKENYEINLKCEITYNNKTYEKQYIILCVMAESVEKVNKVIASLTDYYSAMEITGDIELPTKERKYSTNITWMSYSPDILTDDGKYIQPLMDINVKFLVEVQVGNILESSIIIMKVKGEEYMNKWEKVEALLDRICKKEIKTQSYYLYGYEVGYESVPTKNIGYLPFYQNEELKVTEDILPDDSPLKANELRKSTNYICLHNTGMADPKETAYGLNKYIHETTRVASWHFSVDDKEAYQELKLDEVGWHAGDGSSVYGDRYYNNTYNMWCIGGGNRNSVGIEMCVYSGCDFNMVMRNTAKLVSKLLVKYNLTPADVRQHHDFSGKDCPQVIRAANRWNEMLELISIEYFARTELNGVTFEWTSLSPEYLDNTGKIINNPNTNPYVEYQVKVTIDGESKNFNFKSKLLPL